MSILARHEDEIDLEKLRSCFNELAQYDISEGRIKGNIDVLLQRFA